MTTGTSSIVQVRPDELADTLTADFQRRNEPQFAWKSAVSSFMAIPVLRGLWPMSAVYNTAASQARDVSGNAIHLTNTDISLFGYTNLFPWVEFVSGSYLFVADSGAAGTTDLTGTETYVAGGFRGASMGAWVYFAGAASTEILPLAPQCGGHTFFCCFR
jgi:hypothetical protein